jgi:hypothetical protein
MDDWHRKLARELVSETPAGALPDGAATMEIAFGSARAAVTYALELARAHRLPATGSVAGDHVWLRFGDGRAKFTLNRRQEHVEIDVTLPGSPSGDARTERSTLVRWDAGARALRDAEGATIDLGAQARSAIDGLIADWRARPRSEAEKKVSSAPPPDLDDTPTRG